jgi:hypothetical protein
MSAQALALGAIVSFHGSRRQRLEAEFPGGKKTVRHGLQACRTVFVRGVQFSVFSFRGIWPAEN